MMTFPFATRGAIVSVYMSCGNATRDSQITLPVSASSAWSRPSMIGAKIIP
jgi:hypothetical protein